MYANINGDETTGTRERFNLPASGAITRHPVEVVSKRCVCMYVKVHVCGHLVSSAVPPFPGTIEIRALPISMNHGSLNLHLGREG